MLSYCVSKTKWRNNNGGGELGQRFRFRFLLWRLSAVELANLHNRDEFCTGQWGVECVTQREGKAPPFLQAPQLSGDGAFLLHPFGLSSDSPRHLAGHLHQSSA